MIIHWLLCVFVLGAPAAPPGPPAPQEKVLLVLSAGGDVVCEIVRETKSEIVVRLSGKEARIDPRMVLRRVAEKDIPREIQERKKALPDDDPAACLRLALLCVEVGREKEAALLIELAQACLRASAERAKVDAKPPAEGEAPWPPAEGAYYTVEVRKRIDGVDSDDTVRGVRVQQFLASAGWRRFSGLTGSNVADDYIFRIGMEARKTKTQTFMGGVPIGNEWEGRLNCVVRHGRTGKEVFRMSVPPQTATCSVNLHGEEELLNDVLDTFFKQLRKEPAFSPKSGEPAK